MEESRPTINASLFKLQPFEAAELAKVSLMPGFDIIKRIMDLAVRAENDKIIQINPLDPGYDEKVRNQTLMARASNSFCSTVRMAILANLAAAEQQEAKAQLERLEADAELES